MRTRNAKRDTALVVHIDVDNTPVVSRSVTDRHRELDAACVRAGVPVRTSAERVGWLVPRREIETWIHFFLSGGAVDEGTSYPKLTDHEADCGPAAVAFTTHARAGTTPSGAPPSLSTGLVELRRAL